jgi:hypothetical protein
MSISQKKLKAEFADVLKGNIGKKMAIAAFVTLFWCTITGVGVCLIMTTCWKSFYARQYFLPTQGVVLSSKVVSSHSSKSTTYRPKIEYRYSIHGKEYVSDQYNFDSAFTGDSFFAHAVVNANAQDRVITVYYDPRDPSQAVIDRHIPDSTYFFMLFQQQFILVGLAMIGWTVTLPWRQRQLATFLKGDVTLPWTVPSWGTVYQDFDWIEIVKKNSFLATTVHFMLSYGITCIVEMAILAFYSSFFGYPSSTVIILAFLLSAGVGTVLTLRKLVVGAKVIISPTFNSLTVESRLRYEKVALDAIESLRLKYIPYPEGVEWNNETIRYILLEITTIDGREIPVHAFKYPVMLKDETRVIARKVLVGLASLMAVNADADIVSLQVRKASSTTPKNISAAFRFLRKFLWPLGNEANYSDLT